MQDTKNRRGAMQFGRRVPVQAALFAAGVPAGVQGRGRLGVVRGRG